MDSDPTDIDDNPNSVSCSPSQNLPYDPESYCSTIHLLGSTLITYDIIYTHSPFHRLKTQYDPDDPTNLTFYLFGSTFSPFDHIHLQALISLELIKTATWQAADR